MSCNKNGIKREGESCSLNNNCVYPNCMKELELEAEKYALDKQNDTTNKYYIALESYEAGATSKYVEKQKLEFAIEQLKKASMLIVSQHERKANLRIIIELEQKLSEL